MYDLSEPVVCRCMTQCIVKILSDQWFLNYSDPQWKALAHAAVAQMTIYPDSAKPWFNTVIDWLREWACAQNHRLWNAAAMGKRLDNRNPKRLHSLHGILHHKQTHKTKQHQTTERLTPEVFDYIFYGKGNAEELCKSCWNKADLLDSMRNEFLYWYPFDLRNSAKELVPNHLSFCIFHHAALFPPEHWPKAISVNGMLMVEGQGMHKSKGNFITMKGAVEKYGADATRCGLLLGAEGMDDPDWRAENISDLQRQV